MRLRGRSALVTGAGSGIGRAIALRFAEEGARVAVNDLRLETARETVAKLPASGPPGRALAGDVSDSEQVRAMFAELDEHFAHLDILVNNAGSEDGIRDTLGLSDEAWDQMLGVHLSGTFYCTRAAIARMAKAEGGSIVNISSVAALMGGGMVHYSAAKAGVLGLTRAVAADVGRLRIRVNAICPGYVDTPMTQVAGPRGLERAVSRTPLGRAGEPADIASTAVFLASDEGSFFTGQWLSPNGGMLMI